MTRLRACDAAVEVLTETKNAAVMAGDDGLIYAIAERYGHADGPVWMIERRVLAALTFCPGPLRPGKTRNGRGRLVRVFRMPPDGAWWQR